MALTREYKQTVLGRIKRDVKFARALYAEAINALLEGEMAEGLSMLRDLVHAQITFKTLARKTGYGEKALHRMLSRQGNPTTRSLLTINKTIREDLGIRPRVTISRTEAVGQTVVRKQVGVLDKAQRRIRARAVTWKGKVSGAELLRQTRP